MDFSSARLRRFAVFFNACETPPPPLKPKRFSRRTLLKPRSRPPAAAPAAEPSVPRPPRPSRLPRNREGESEVFQFEIAPSQRMEDPHPTRRKRVAALASGGLCGRGAGIENPAHDATECLGGMRRRRFLAVALGAWLKLSPGEWGAGDRGDHHGVAGGRLQYGDRISGRSHFPGKSSAWRGGLKDVGGRRGAHSFAGGGCHRLADPGTPSFWRGF